MLVNAFHFSPLNVNQTYFRAARWTHLARCLLLLTYWGAMHKVKRPQWHLAVFLASSTNPLSADWLLAPGNYYRNVCSLAGYHLCHARDSLMPASSAFYLMMSVNLNINNTITLHQQILLKQKNLRHNICRFTCLTCSTQHYKTWRRLASDVN